MLNRSHALAAAALAAALFAAPAPALAKPCPGGDVAPTIARVDQARHATLCLLNHERALHGLRHLRANRRLRSAASAYSWAMVRNDFFDHVSPSGSTLSSRVHKTAYLA